jgi:hypothetical protein
MKYYDGTNWIDITECRLLRSQGLRVEHHRDYGVYNRRLFLIEKQQAQLLVPACRCSGRSGARVPAGSGQNRGGYTMAAGLELRWRRWPGRLSGLRNKRGRGHYLQGTNPSDATAWSRVGVYFLGKPLGRRCLVKYGGDLILLTQNGAFPLSLALQSATVDYGWR